MNTLSKIIGSATIWLFMVLLSGLYSAVMASQYHVSGYDFWADDNNPGTSEQPLKTISEGLRRAMPGDSVIIGPGVYREVMELVRGGLPDQYITLKAETPGSVFVMGSDIVTGWENAFDQTWVRHGWEHNSQQLFAGGIQLQQIGPNSLYHSLELEAGQALPIIGSDLSDMFPGSFWYDTQMGALYAWLPDGSSPNEQVMEASVRPFLVAPNTLDHIIFQGLIFAHSSTGTTGDSVSMVNVGGDNWQLKDNYFFLADMSGLSISGTNHQIMDNTFLLNGMAGIYMPGGMKTDQYVRNVSLMGNETSINNTRGFHFSLNPGGISLSGDCSRVDIERHLAWRNHMFGIVLDSECEMISIKKSYVADNVLGVFARGSRELYLGNSIFSRNIYAVGADYISNSHVFFNTIHSSYYGIQFMDSSAGSPGNNNNTISSNIFSDSLMIDLGLYDPHFLTRNNTSQGNAYLSQDEIFNFWFDELGFPRLTTSLNDFQTQSGLEMDSIRGNSIWQKDEYMFFPPQNAPFLNIGQFTNVVVADDFYSQSRPWGTGPDLGAVEFTSTMETASYPHELKLIEPVLPEPPAEPEPPAWELTIQISGQGRVELAPDKEQYDWGDRVSISALADENWIFTGWGGDLSGTDSPVQIEMYSDYIITAGFEYVEPVPEPVEGLFVFDPGSYQAGYNPVGDVFLHRNEGSLDFGTGTGIVESASPVGSQVMRFTTDVRRPYGNGADRWLWWNEVPDQEEVEYLYLFRRNSDRDTELLGCMRVSAQEGLNAYCAGLRNNAQEVRGRLVEDGNISNAGNVNHGLGTDTVNDWIWVRGRVEAGSHIIKARTWLHGDTEPSGWMLEWSDPDQSISSGGAGLQVYLRTSEDAIDLAWWSVGVRGFGALEPEELPVTDPEPEPEPEPVELFGLEVVVVGEGAVIVTPDLSFYEQDESVQLLAEPDDQWVFSGWSGDFASTDPTITLVMDQHKLVTATFEYVEAEPEPQIFVFDPNAFESGHNPVGNSLVQRRSGSNELGVDTGIIGMSTPVGSKVLRFTTDVTSEYNSGAERWLLWTEAPTDLEEIEFLYLFRRSHARDTELLGCLRMSSEGEFETYAAGLRNNQNEIRGRQVLGNEISNAGNINHNLTTDTVNDWIWVRGRMDAGSYMVKAKTWLHGHQEPESWMLEWQDPSQGRLIGGAGLQVYLRKPGDSIDLAWWSVGSLGLSPAEPENEKWQYGNVYYVSSNGDDSSPGTKDQPWQTITKANAVLKAGDLVYIREGIYVDQQIAPENSGSENSRITYKNYNEEIVIITETYLAVDLNNRSYISIQGILFYNIDVFGRIINGNHNLIKNCIFKNMRTFERWRGFWIGENSSYNTISGCTMGKYGDFVASHTDRPVDRGDMIVIGAIPAGNNSHNLIENSYFYHGGHAVIVLNSKYNIVRNNYFHNEEWYEDQGTLYGNRIMEIRADGGGAWNLVEGNRFAATGVPNDTDFSAGIQLTSNNNIIRSNHFYASKGPGIHLHTTPRHSAEFLGNNYIFHNNFFYNGYSNISGPTGREAGLLIAGSIHGTVVKNNIFYLNKNDKSIVEQDYPVNSVIENNHEAGDPMFVDADYLLLNPLNKGYPDFNLEAGSPCINAGAFIARTISSGNNTTTIPVDDAHFFTDGWGLIEGDHIKLEGYSEKLQVVGIDYESNILYVNIPIYFYENQGVSLLYYDAAPDIGVIQYK